MDNLWTICGRHAAHKLPTGYLCLKSKTKSKEVSQSKFDPYLPQPPRSSSQPTVFFAPKNFKAKPDILFLTSLARSRGVVACSHYNRQRGEQPNRTWPYRKRCKPEGGHARPRLPSLPQRCKPEGAHLRPRWSPSATPPCRRAGGKLHSQLYHPAGEQPAKGPSGPKKESKNKQRL